MDKIEAYTIDTISKFEISRMQKRIAELEDYIDNVIKSISDIMVDSKGVLKATVIDTVDYNANEFGIY